MSKQLTDEQILLAEENQRESKIFLQEIEKVDSVKKQLLDKKVNAGKEITRLRLELAQLDKEYLFETDQEKIRELAAKKKDIRYEIDEYESIKDTMYNPVIKDMLKGIEQFRVKAEKENEKFYAEKIKIEKQCREEWDAYNKAMQDRLDKLEVLNYQHAFTQAYNKYTNMKMDKAEW